MRDIRTVPPGARGFYDQDFTTSIPAAAAGGGSNPPSFAMVKLLCHFDGTNGSTVYVDSSNTAHNPINASGTTISTANPLFGTGAIHAAGGRAVATTNAAYAIGANDFAVEFAWRTTAPGFNSGVFDCADYYGATGSFLIESNTVFNFYNSTGTRTLRITGGTVSTSTYQRIALSRVSGVTRLFIDGVKVGANYTDGTSYNQGALGILGDLTANHSGLGDIDELRFTIGWGIAANYTVASGPFPDS